MNRFLCRENCSLGLFLSHLYTGASTISPPPHIVFNATNRASFYRLSFATRIAWLMTLASTNARIPSIMGPISIQLPPDSRCSFLPQHATSRANGGLGRGRTCDLPRASARPSHAVTSTHPKFVLLLLQGYTPFGAKPSSGNVARVGEFERFASLSYVYIIHQIFIFVKFLPNNFHCGDGF